MDLTFEFWFLFPISIVIATVAMASGVGGAVFFSPLLMVGLKLEPQIAIGVALITELFGFGSGLVAYFKAKLIDFSLAKNLMLFSIPAAVVGSYYSNLIPGVILKAIFATGLLFIGYQLFSSWRKEEREKKESQHREEFKENFESELTAKDGTVYRYTICNKPMGRLFAAIGGAFVGMISVGLAELQEYQLVARCKVPTPVAVGTSIFVVVITVLAASFGHIYEFVSHGSEQMGEVVNLIIYTVPGVVIGGQLGPKLQKVVQEDKMKISISILFILIGIFIFYSLTI